MSHQYRDFRIQSRNIKILEDKIERPKKHFYGKRIDAKFSFSIRNCQNMFERIGIYIIYHMSQAFSVIIFIK